MGLRATENRDDVRKTFDRGASGGRVGGGSPRARELAELSRLFATGEIENETFRRLRARGAAAERAVSMRSSVELSHRLPDARGRSDGSGSQVTRDRRTIDQPGAGEFPPFASAPGDGFWGEGSTSGHTFNFYNSSPVVTVTEDL